MMYLIGQSRSCSPQGNRYLRHLHRLRDVVEQFLQRAERAEPAAERPPPPEQQPRGDRAPEQEDQRRRQEVFPAEAGHQRIGEGQDVDHRQLRVRVPAEPDQNEQQITAAHPDIELGAAHQRVLEEEDQRSARRARTVVVPILTALPRQIRIQSGSSSAAKPVAGPAATPAPASRPAAWRCGVGCLLPHRRRRLALDVAAPAACSRDRT